MSSIKKKKLNSRALLLMPVKFVNNAIIIFTVYVIFLYVYIVGIY